MKYIAFIIFFALAAEVDAQRYRNPQSYFRQFQNENRKLRIKNLRYLESSLKGEEERRVSKYREMVLEQAQESKRELERVGPYEDYDILQKEYVKSMQMYVDALSKNFGKSDSLGENRYNSYEDLQRYYDAITKAENQMLDAGYRIEKAEEHFAKNYYLTIERDEELEERYRLLDEVTLYSRDMTLSFFRVNSVARKFLKAVEKDNMDSLPGIVTDMRKAINTSREEIKGYENFDGDKKLYGEVEDYLEEMQEEVDESLGELARNLQNEFLDEKQRENTEKQLREFSERHEYRKESFFEAKRELIEDYLPD